MSWKCQFCNFINRDNANCSVCGIRSGPIMDGLNVERVAAQVVDDGDEKEIPPPLLPPKVKPKQPMVGVGENLFRHIPVAGAFGGVNALGGGHQPLGGAPAFNLFGGGPQQRGGAQAAAPAAPFVQRGGAQAAAPAAPFVQRGGAFGDIFCVDCHHDNQINKATHKCEKRFCFSFHREPVWVCDKHYYSWHNPPVGGFGGF